MRPFAHRGLIALVAVVSLARPAAAESYIWSAAVSDDWSNPARWTPTGTPGLPDSVFLNVGGGPTYTITVSNTQAVGFLSISSGQAVLRNASGSDTFTIANLIMIGGAFQQDGGTLSFSGGGTVFGGSSFAFSGGTVQGTGILNVHNGGFTWGGGTLQASVNLTQGGALVGDLAAKGVGTGGSLGMSGGTTTFRGELVYLGNGMATIGSGATMNWLGDGVVRRAESYAGPATFTNNGVLMKTGGAGAGRLGPGLTLTNTGTIRVSSGSLWVESDLANTGTLRADAGAELRVRAGTTALNSNSQITGAGTFRLAGGSPAGAALDVLADTASAAATTVHLESGTVRGTNTLTVNGPLTWTGAVVGGSATVTALGGGSIDGPATVSTGTVNLAGGTVTWSAGDLTFDGSGRLVIGPGGALEAASGAGSLALAHVSGSPVVRNEGTFRVAVPGGGSLLVPAGITVENAGALRVTSGSIDLRGGLTNTGTIDLAASTLLSVNGGTLTLNPGSAITGTGRFALTGPGSTLTLNTTFTTPAGLQYTIGTINGTGTLTASGPFDWGVSDAGAVGGSVTVNATGGGDWTGGGTRRVGTGTVNLTGGTFEWAGGPVAFAGSGRLTVGPGAVLDLRDDSGVTWSGGAPVLTVNGTFQKTGGTGTSVAAPGGVTFTNAGVVSVSAGTLYFDPTATLTNYTGGALAGGTWRAAGATLDFGSRPVSVVGPNTTVEVSGPAGSFPALTALTQSNGTLRLLGGATLTPTAALVNTAGVVEVGAGSTFGKALVVQNFGTAAGAGTVTGGIGVLSGGRLSPGPGPAAAPGPAALTVGTTVMVGGSTYVWDVNSWSGGTAGVDFDQLKGRPGVKLDLSLASPASPVVLQLRGLTAANAPGPVPGFDPNQFRSWVIADYSDGNATGGVAGFAPGKVAINTAGFQHDLAGGTFFLSTDAAGNKLMLNFVPVPEPGSALLACALAGAALAAALAAARRPRRHATS
jgi:hypothetical protein